MSSLAKTIVKEGFLSKHPKKGTIGGWKRRFIQLHTTCQISYYTSNDLKDLKGEIDLSVCKTVDCVSKSSKVEFGFEIACPDRVWQFKATSSQLRDEWIAAIQKVITNNNNNNNHNQLSKTKGIIISAGDADTLIKNMKRIEKFIQKQDLKNVSNSQPSNLKSKNENEKQKKKEQQNILQLLKDMQSLLSKKNESTSTNANLSDADFNTLLNEVAPPNDDEAKTAVTTGGVASVNANNNNVNSVTTTADPPKDLLAAWVNYHLNQNGEQKQTMSNWTSDFADGKVYMSVLASIIPDFVATADDCKIEYKDSKSRCEAVLSLAAKIGVNIKQTSMTGSEIMMKGDEQANIEFTAALFRQNPGLDGKIIAVNKSNNGNSTNYDASFLDDLVKMSSQVNGNIVQPGYDGQDTSVMSVQIQKQKTDLMDDSKSDVTKYLKGGDSDSKSIGMDNSGDVENIMLKGLSCKQLGVMVSAACENKNLTLMEEILKYSKNKYKDNMSIYEKYIINGAYAGTNGMRTALHSVAGMRNYRSSSSNGKNGKNSKCIQMIELLIKYGVDVNIKNRYGDTALLDAINSLNVEATVLLCNHGAAIQYPPDSRRDHFNHNNNNNNVKKTKRLVNGWAALPIIRPNFFIQALIRLFEQVECNANLIESVLETLFGEESKAQDTEDDNVFEKLKNEIRTKCPFFDNFVQDINFIQRHSYPETQTITHAACANTNRNIIKLLEKYGANINFGSNNNNVSVTPLEIAIEKNNFDTASYLLDKNALIKKKFEKDFQSPDYDAWKELSTVYPNFWQDMFYAACQQRASGGKDILQEIMKEYGQKGGKNSDLINVKISNSNNRHNEYTPLHAACAGGHLDIVQFLVKNGANVNALNKQNETPLGLAITKNHFNVVFYLLNDSKTNACVSIKNGKKFGWDGIMSEKAGVLSEISPKFWFTCLNNIIIGSETKAKAKKDAEMIGVLHAKMVECNGKLSESQQQYALVNACKRGDLKIIEILLTSYQAKMNVDALMAIIQHHPRLISHIVDAAIKHDADTTLADLIRMACDANYHFPTVYHVLRHVGSAHMTNDNNSEAKENDNKKVVNFEVNGTDKLNNNNGTLLHYVCGKTRQESATSDTGKSAALIIDALIQHGANVNALNDKNETPLSLCFTNKRAFESIYLLDNNATVFDSTNESKLCKLVGWNLFGDYGNNKKKEEETNDYLYFFNDVLIIYCKKMHDDSRNYTEQLCLEIIDICNKNIPNFDINLQRSGTNPLRGACYYDDLHLVKVLLDRGATFATQTFNGATILIDIARVPLCAPMVRFILEHLQNKQSKDEFDEYINATDGNESVGLHSNKTALFNAVNNKAIESAKHLCAYNADILKNEALSVMFSSKNPGLLKFLFNNGAFLSKYSLKHIIVDHKNSAGFNALFLAVYHEMPDIVSMFLQMLYQNDKNIDFDSILKQEQGRGNFKATCFGHAKVLSDSSIFMFLNNICMASKQGNMNKLSSMLGGSLSLNRESALNQYWQIRYERRFCESLLVQLDNHCLQQITRSVCNALIKKLPIANDLLILSFEYCKRNTSYEHKMLEILNQSINHSLSHLNGAKAYDYLWFKKYILNSNIWYQRISNATGENNLVYDVIYQTISQQLAVQQRYLKSEIDSLKWNETQVFEQLMNFNVDSKNKDDDDDVRQDNLECNKADYNQLVLRASNDPNYQSHKEYESKVYLTKLLITARSLNDQFQTSMKQIIDRFKKSKYYNSGGGVGSDDKTGVYFKAGPVKTFERCVVKSQTKYQDAAWPGAAKILDILRCSIVFMNCSDMIDAINYFVECVTLGKANTIKSIVRIKNGFYDIKQWEDELSDYEYRDIKLNVVISGRNEHNSNNNNNNNNNNNDAQEIIGEIQFILASFAKVKDTTHSLYSVLRRKPLTDDIRDLLLADETLDMESKVDEDNNDINVYRARMKNIVKQRDLESFENEIILDNGQNIMANYLNFDGTQYGLLHYLCQKDWNKAAKLLYSDVLHWNRILAPTGDNAGSNLLVDRHLSVGSDENNKDDKWRQFVVALKQK